jgi:shikimate kinase
LTNKGWSRRREVIAAVQGPIRCDSRELKLERHVVLVGTMGAGKSTVGRLVAASLGWPFRDNDEGLVDREGRTAGAIAIDEGAARLHEREVDILLENLAREGPDVVAAAASVVTAPRARARLRSDAFVFWLHATPDALEARLRAPGDRPSFGSSPARLAGRLQADRTDLYRTVADREVDTTGCRPDEIAAVILTELSPRTAG